MPREATLAAPRKTKPAAARRSNGVATPKVTTVEIRELMDLRGQIEAINLTQAVIEFELDGTIIHANDAFLSTMGYTIDEVKGRHHRLFVEPALAASCPSKSAVRIFCAVTSVAYFTTLKGLPSKSMVGVYDA